MQKNLTLKLDDEILKKCRHAAVEANKSLSGWVADIIAREVAFENGYLSAKRRAVKRLEKGFALGGQALGRDEIYEA